MTIANLPSSMTLGRFVRVTLDNLRLLINTYSGSTVAPSMPESSNNDIAVSDLSDVDRSVIAAEKTDVELMPHPTQTTVTQNGATDTDEAHAESAHAEDIQPDDAHMQPALNLATEHDAVILAAETESGALLVRAGDMAMSMPGMLESLLFVADAPVEATQLARVLNTPVEVVEGHLRQLAEEYHAQGRGLRVAERNGRFQMVTAPAAATLIEAFLNLDMTTKLSAPALETLAVVAYRQPVTRAQVEAVRGVDCSGILRSLLQRGLVEEVDRLDAPGRPVRYGVTDLFMQHFGLTGLHELPPLESVEAEQLDGALEREA